MKNKTHIAILTVAAICQSAFTHAGGLWITEFGAPSMGRAAAGAEAGVDDASAGLHNPAAMSRIQSTQAMATVGLVASQIEFDVERGSLLNGTGDGGKAGSVAPSASAFYVRPLNDRWTVGANFYALTGSALDYDNDWAGRFQATSVDLVFAGLQPTVSYRVNDHVSVGAGLFLGYTFLELKVAVPNPTTPLQGPDGEATIDGDDFDIGFNAGVLFSLSDKTRLGIAFQSELKPNYSGDVELDPADLSVGVEASLPLASVVRMGLTHEFNDRFSGHVTVGWEDWSTLDAIIFSTETQGLASVRDWDDTYHFAAGLTFQPRPNWTLHGGVAFDTDPTKSADRTADLPVDRQVRYAFGAKHTRPSGMEIGGHIVYADYGNASIESRGYGGKFSSNDILFASVSFNWPLQHRRQ